MFGIFKKRTSETPPPPVPEMQSKKASSAKEQFLAGFDIESYLDNKLSEIQSELSQEEENKGSLEVTAGLAERKLKGEDSIFASEKIIVSADGLSTPKGGEIASRLAVEEIKKLPDLTEAKKSEAIAEMTKAFETAQRAILEANKGKEEKDIPKTTLSAIALYNHGREAVIGHIGDSSICLMRDGKIKRLTTEHSNLSLLERQGIEVNYDENDEDSLDRKLISYKKDEHDNDVVDYNNSAIDKDYIAKLSQALKDDLSGLTVRKMRSSLYYSLGASEKKFKPEIKTLFVQPGDVFLSFSDGLDKGIRFEEIESIVNENSDKTPGEIAEILVQKGTDKDDVSVAVMKIEKPGMELSEEDLEEVAA